MSTKPRPILAWYFAPPDRRLRYGDGRKIVIGETHTVSQDQALISCGYGLHASRRPLDALKYAPGPWCYQVEIAPPYVCDTDKLVGYSRTYLRGFDATKVLRRFARECAEDVLHLWDAPPVVKMYLRTGNERLREEARVAARAAWVAARGAAWAARAAFPARAAWAAARDAAWAAARRDTAWAAWAAARTTWKAAQNKKLEGMLSEGMR